jgi:hypothetical protein
MRNNENAAQAAHNVTSAAEPVQLDRIEVEVRDGCVVVVSDNHYGWGEPASTAHRAAVKFCGDLQPELIIANGDAVDFPSVSKHQRIGFEQRPLVVDEIVEAQERLGEICDAAPNAGLIYNVGNHCKRLMDFVSNQASALEGMWGTCLSHHFPAFQFAWATTLNPNAAIPVNVQHRIHGGATAAMRNISKLDIHCVTSHTHLAGIATRTEWRGTLYGVDTGCVAAVGSRAFRNYVECSHTGWRSAFAVLTFAGGELTQPELVLVTKESHVPGCGEVVFRGKLIRV